MMRDTPPKRMSFGLLALALMVVLAVIKTCERRGNEPAEINLTTEEQSERRGGDREGGKVERWKGGKVAPAMRPQGSSDLPLSKGFVAALNAETGDWEYATPLAASNGNVVGKCLAIAPDGSLRIGGNFQGTLTVGSHSLESNGMQDIFIAKFQYLYSPIIYPPAAPTGVQIWRADGSDVVLSWPAVTQDTSGNPIEVAYYVVYTCAEPAEDIDAWTKLAQTSATSWRHVGILATTDRLFYRIAAVYVP